MIDWYLLFPALEPPPLFASARSPCCRPLFRSAACCLTLPCVFPPLGRRFLRVLVSGLHAIHAESRNPSVRSALLSGSNSACMAWLGCAGKYHVSPVNTTRVPAQVKVTHTRKQTSTRKRKNSQNLHGTTSLGWLWRLTDKQKSS